MGTRKSKSAVVNTTLPQNNLYLSNIALVKPYSSFVPFSHHVVPITRKPLVAFGNWTILKFRVGMPFSKIPLAMPGFYGL